MQDGRDTFKPGEIQTFTIRSKVLNLKQAKEINRGAVIAASLKSLKGRERKIKIKELGAKTITRDSSYNYSKGFLVNEQLKGNEFKFFNAGLINCLSLTNDMRCSVTQNQPSRLVSDLRREVNAVPAQDEP